MEDGGGPKLKILQKANVFDFLSDFWAGVFFVNCLFQVVSKSVFGILARRVFPLGIFAEIWHKSYSYIPHTHSDFEGLCYAAGCETYI